MRKMARLQAKLLRPKKPFVRTPYTAIVRSWQHNAVTSKGPAWKGLGKYLVKKGDKAFGPEGLVQDPAALARSWYDAGDCQMYTVVISPNDPRGMDLEHLVRGAMLRTSGELQEEAKIRGELEWVAAQHHDTEDPHAHVIVRGRAGGVRTKLQKKNLEYRIGRYCQQVAKELKHGISYSPQTRLSRSVQLEPDHRRDYRDPDEQFPGFPGDRSPL